MANTVTIQNLPAADGLAGTELVPIVQNSITKQTAISNFGPIGTFTQAGSSETRTVQGKLRDIVSAFDFMTAAQISDVQSRNATISVSAAINAAIMHLYNTGGGTLYLPAGTYMITNSIYLKTRVNICGEGRDATQIQTQNYGPGASFPDGAMLRGTDIDYVILERFTLRGVSLDGASSSGITIDLLDNDNSGHIVIRDMFINDQAGNGIKLQTPILSRLQNVKIRYCAGTAFYLYDGGTSTTLSECYAITGLEQGFYLNTMVYCTLISCASEVYGVGYDLVSCSAIALIGCGTEAIVDRSRFGSTLTGISYRTDGSTNSLYNCYSRDSQRSNDFVNSIFPTTATWTSGATTITVASTSGILTTNTIPLYVTGAGIPDLTTVVSVVGSVVTLSAATTAGAATATQVIFRPAQPWGVIEQGHFWGPWNIFGCRTMTEQQYIKTSTTLTTSLAYNSTTIIVASNAGFMQSAPIYATIDANSTGTTTTFTSIVSGIVVGSIVEGSGTRANYTTYVLTISTVGGKTVITTTQSIAAVAGVTLTFSGAAALIQFQTNPADPLTIRTETITYTGYTGTGPYTLTGVHREYRVTSNSGYPTIAAGSYISTITGNTKYLNKYVGMQVQNIPTMGTGNPSGTVWSNSGVLNIVP